MTDVLEILRLFTEGEETSEFAPARPQAPANVALSAASAETPHHIPLTAEATPEANVSYILQVRPDGDTRWHTNGR